MAGVGLAGAPRGRGTCGKNSAGRGLRAGGRVVKRPARGLRAGEKGNSIRNAPTGGRARAGDAWEAMGAPRRRGACGKTVAAPRGRGTCGKTVGAPRGRGHVKKQRGARLTGGERGGRIRHAPTGGRARAGACGKRWARGAGGGRVGKRPARGLRAGKEEPEYGTPPPAAGRGRGACGKTVAAAARAGACEKTARGAAYGRGKRRPNTARPHRRQGAGGGVWETMGTRRGRGTCGKTPGARLTGGGRGAVRRCRGLARSRDAGPRRAAPRRA